MDGLQASFQFSLPLKNTTFHNFLGNMGYMSVKDENFPRLLGVLRGKQFSFPAETALASVGTPGEKTGVHRWDAGRCQVS